MTPSYQSPYQLPLDSEDMCTCASINPGRRVASPRSMTRAPSGTFNSAPTAWMLSPFTTIMPGSDTSAANANTCGIILLAMAYPQMNALRNSVRLLRLLRDDVGLFFFV